MRSDCTPKPFPGQGPNKRTALLFAVFCLLLLLAGNGPAGADTWRVEVRWVPDGDTLFLTTGQRIRLKGIDAPETGHDKQPRQYYALESRKRLADLVEGRTLNIEAETLNADRYGRILAYVWLSDGRFLNRLLLRQGTAFFYPHPRQDQPHEEELLRGQQRAMRERRGFWGRILTMPAARDRYTGNANSLRFHTQNCSYGRRINPDNRRPFANLRLAFDAGYAPCCNCTPWPLAK